MKTTILITGGNSGNRTILNALNPNGFIENLPFNNYSVSYNSTSEAKACLRFAYQELAEEGAIQVSYYDGKWAKGLAKYGRLSEQETKTPQLQELIKPDGTRVMVMT